MSKNYNKKQQILVSAFWILCSSIPTAHQPPATTFAIIKGQGRVLGSSSSSGPTNPVLSRPSSQTPPQPWREPSFVTSNSKPKPLPQKAPISDQNDRSDLMND